ncbi:MAG: hypothetical protein G8237_03450 [Magnetococcales bacterium]|nr:hypothetical protein [Magnetococcales bacterium]NGZ05389.1 hypothetical protein [Magnetococcales bacterium]
MTKHPFLIVPLLGSLLLTACAMDATTPDSSLKENQESKPAPREAKGTASTITHPKPPPPPPGHPSSDKPEKLIGSTGQELIRKFGPPNLTMDLTMPNRVHAEGYLYYPKEGKGCIHTFIVLQENNKVMDYSCR